MPGTCLPRLSLATGPLLSSALAGKDTDSLQRMNQHATTPKARRRGIAAPPCRCTSLSRKDAGGPSGKDLPPRTSPLPLKWRFPSRLDAPSSGGHLPAIECYRGFVLRTGFPRGRPFDCRIAGADPSPPGPCSFPLNFIVHHFPPRVPNLPRWHSFSGPVGFHRIALPLPRQPISQSNLLTPEPSDGLFSGPLSISPFPD